MRVGSAVLLMLLASCAAACGAHSGSAAATSATCQQVSAVLSDGPDPTADPVGYAEAQIKPLAGVHTSDKALSAALAALDRAFQAEYATNGGHAAAASVASASSALDALCPGATA